MMDWNWSGDGLGVAARMFCTEVGEWGKPQESMVAIAIFAMSLVTSPTQRELWSPRLRWPGKQFLFCSGDATCTGMGRGAEDASMVGDPLLERPMVDIIGGLQE